MDSLRERVQRYTGKSDYEFGDITKAYFRRISSGGDKANTPKGADDEASKRTAAEEHMLEVLDFCRARLELNGWKGKVTVAASAELAVVSTKLSLSVCVTRMRGTAARADNSGESGDGKGDVMDDIDDAASGIDDSDDFELVDAKDAPPAAACDRAQPRSSLVQDARQYVRMRSRRRLLQAEGRVRAVALRLRTASISGTIGCAFQVSLPPWLLPGIAAAVDVSLELDITSVVLSVEVGAPSAPAAPEASAAAARNSRPEARGSRSSVTAVQAGNRSDNKKIDEVTARFANALLAAQMRLRGMHWSGKIKLQADLGIVRLWVACPLRLATASASIAPTQTGDSNLPTVDDDQPEEGDAATGPPRDAQAESKGKPKSAGAPSTAAGKGAVRAGPSPDNGPMAGLFRRMLERNIAQIDRMAAAFAASGISGTGAAEFAFRVFGFGMTLSFEVELASAAGEAQATAT